MMIRSVMQLNGRAEPGISKLLRPITGCTWSELRPNGPNSDYDWRALEAWLAQCRALGAEPMYEFTGPPAWANSKGPAEAHRYPAAHIQLWTNYVYDVLAHLAGRVRWFSVWNEADQASYYLGTVRELKQMHDTVWTAVRNDLPGAVVIGGGNVVSLVSEGNGCKFLGALLATCGSMNAIGVHVYPSGLAEVERVPEMLRNARATADLNGGAGKPLVVTEMGVLNGAFAWLPEAAQALVMRRMFSDCEAAGCLAALFYAHGHETLGMTAGAARLAVQR